MKQRKISGVIKKRFKKIEKLYRKIISRFEMESIHEFRTEIKKLRAFFRILNVESDDHRLKIPKKMKIFYGYSGTIRNLQLQLKNVNAFAGNPQYSFTDTYIDYLRKIIDKWKENAIEFTGPDSNFCADKKKIITQLPKKLRRVSAKKFLQKKMIELAGLIKDLPGDEVLHSIRKILKDISYNQAFIKRYSKLLPPDFSEDEKLKAFTELLGFFLDKGIGIILLETYCRDCEENGLFIEKETGELQELEGVWKNEKQELSHLIYLQPGLQQLAAVN